MKIVSFAGSLRQNSYNKILIHAAASVAPPFMSFEILDLRKIPLYNADIEDIETPPSVIAFKEKIAAADGLYIATPEYNRAYSGVLKNAIDWASRKPNPMFGKPVAISGASPGRYGAINAQNQLLRLCLAVGMHPLEHPRLVVDSIEAKLIGYQLVDVKTVARLENQLSAFAKWIRQLQQK